MVTGKNIRDWLYVEDHCKAIDMVFHKGVAGERYNIGGHNEKRNIDIVKLILKRLGKSEDLIEYVEDRKGHDYRYAIDPSKIKAELGWEPETKFEDGIVKTIDWYIANPDWLKIRKEISVSFYEANTLTEQNGKNRYNKRRIKTNIIRKKIYSFYRCNGNGNGTCPNL